jgi:hypothetical protein
MTKCFPGFQEIFTGSWFPGTLYRLPAAVLKISATHTKAALWAGAVFA